MGTNFRGYGSSSRLLDHNLPQSQTADSDSAATRRFPQNDKHLECTVPGTAAGNGTVPARKMSLPAPWQAATRTPGTMANRFSHGAANLARQGKLFRVGFSRHTGRKSKIEDFRRLLAPL